MNHGDYQKSLKTKTDAPCSQKRKEPNMSAKSLADALKTLEESSRKIRRAQRAAQALSSMVVHGIATQEEVLLALPEGAGEVKAEALAGGPARGVLDRPGGLRPAEAEPDQGKIILTFSLDQLKL
jgi:hypothetical protein